MKKKNSVVPRRTSLRPGNPEGDLLDDIHKKILRSSALNGGFDTLLYKISNIEQGQSAVGQKVDKIHDAIYDPNDGIFAKLSEHKLENAKQMNVVSQDISSIKQWKSLKDKQDNEHGDAADQNADKIVSLEKTVEDLNKSKTIAWSILKWIGVAIGGGIVTMLFEFLQNKIH